MAMCYYSSTLKKSTEGQKGDLLTARQFSDTKGFVAATDKSCAVCIKDGAVLQLNDVPELTQCRLQIPAIATATFKEDENGHLFRESDERHTINNSDHLLFGNGKIMLLRDLPLECSAQILFATQSEKQEHDRQMIEAIANAGKGKKRVQQLAGIVSVAAIMALPFIF